MPSQLGVKYTTGHSILSRYASWSANFDFLADMVTRLQIDSIYYSICNLLVDIATLFITRSLTNEIC